MLPRLACLRGGIFVLRRLILFLSLQFTGWDLMRHQCLSFPQFPCLSSDGNALEVFYGAWRFHWGESLVWVCTRFLWIFLVSADQGTRGSVCHLPEQNICATRMKSVVWRAWLAQCVQLPPFWDTDNPCSASIPMCVVTYLWHTKLERGREQTKLSSMELLPIDAIVFQVAPRAFSRKADWPSWPAFLIHQRR